MSKVLIAYFSASGETARLSKTLAKICNGDLFEIEPKEKYSSQDLNWNDNNSRSTMEMNNKNSRPEIAVKVECIDKYDTVFVGFPIWWYEAPRIIETFLESYDFSDKTVIPFATSGSSQMGKTDSILKQSCSTDTKWKIGKRFPSDADENTLKNWINNL